MKRTSSTLLIGTSMVLLCLIMLPAGLFATGTGSRASFTRGGWVGAKYVALGRSGEVSADDVFAIYWNPAGLTELRHQKRISAEEIKEKARTGEVEDISEEDLLRFSDNEEQRFFLDFGVSASQLDMERNVGFTGFAFNLKRGVMGFGLYSILSQGIDRRDYNGIKTGEMDYVGAVGYVSYGWSIGIASLGFSVKGLYEKLAHTNYAGGAVDIGTQIYVLPFLKVGFVAQDLGVGLYPVKKKGSAERKYDFGYPTLRLGLSLISDRGFTLIVSGIKKLEQKSFEYSLGVQLDFLKWASFYLGLNDLSFSTGFTLSVAKLDVSYAFAIDNIDYGYNHTISLAFLF